MSAIPYSVIPDQVQAVVIKDGKALTIHAHTNSSDVKLNITLMLPDGTPVFTQRQLKDHGITSITLHATHEVEVLS